MLTFPFLFNKVFLRDTQVFEAWIESRESVVRDDQMGDSIIEVEELIRRHDDFLKTIDAQEDKLEPIKRFTMVSICQCIIDSILLFYFLFYFYLILFFVYSLC